MTEKYTIHGLNVNLIQECLFWQEGHCECYYDKETAITYPHCIDIPDCDHKQKYRLEAQYNAVVEQNKSLQSELKQKEQECRELKELVEQAKKAPICFQCKQEPCIRQEKEKLQQECEELKEKYKWYEHYKDSALYNKGLCDKKSDEIDRYKQALDEIEECAKNAQYKQLSERIKAELQQILDIIDKADFRTDTTPISEDIEPTKPERLSGETVRAQRKSKTAKGQE